jgi:hypothetical protein
MLGLTAAGDRSGDWVQSLMHGPLQHDALPTTTEQITALLAYRGSANQPMLIPVTSHFYRRMHYTDQILGAATLACADSAELPAAMSSLLCKTPSDHGSELTTTVAVSSYIDTVFGCLKLYSSLQVVYTYNLNSGHCTTCGSSDRPDMPNTVIIVDDCTFLIGVEREAHQLVDAVCDIKHMVNGFNMQHYGDVQFMLAYAAAGLEIQFYAITDNGTQVQWHS